MWQHAIILVMPAVKHRGFTILELLIVVAIIGILAAVTMVLLNSTRAHGRDSRRLEDLRSIENGLHLYAAGHNGLYPEASPAETIDGQTDTLSTKLIADEDMDAVPTDPLHPGMVYQYESDGSTYTLTFCLETDEVAGFAAGCSNTFTQ